MTFNDFWNWHDSEVPPAAKEGRSRLQGDSGKPSTSVFMSSRPN